MEIYSNKEVKEKQLKELEEYFNRKYQGSLQHVAQNQQMTIVSLSTDMSVEEIIHLSEEVRLTFMLQNQAYVTINVHHQDLKFCEIIKPDKSIE